MTDMTEIQRDLLDMNTRYDSVEEQLANRERELQDMLDNVKVYLQVRAGMMCYLLTSEHFTRALSRVILRCHFMTSHVGCALQELQYILPWLEDKEQTTPPLLPLPVSLAHAQDKLKQHQVLSLNIVV